MISAEPSVQEAQAPEPFRTRLAVAGLGFGLQFVVSFLIGIPILFVFGDPRFNPELLTIMVVSIASQVLVYFLLSQWARSRSRPFMARVSMAAMYWVFAKLALSFGISALVI